MAKYKGRSFLVKAGDGATPTEVFTTIGNMKSTSMAINNEGIDVTDKGSGRWRELMSGGIKSMEITLAGVFSNDDTLNDLITKIIDAGDAGIDILNFELVSGRGDKFKGAFQIQSCERAGEFNGEETYSMKLASAGPIVYTAGA